MRISTKLRYGLRAMVDLAQFDSDGPVLVRNIAKRQGISKKYLDNLLVLLKNAGLVRSVRGAKGGYSLAHPPSKMTVLDIAIALEGAPSLIDCIADPSICDRSDICPTLEFWKNMSGVLENFMAKTTLEELVSQCREKQQSQVQMYYL